MNLFSRHKNTVVLAAVLLAQLLALAVQVKRQTPTGPVRLIRLVGVNTIAPMERVLIYAGESVRWVWESYLDLRGVQRENELLRAETGRMRLQQARDEEDLRQAQRLQLLLAFKERWIDSTVAAQVIGTSGMETSRLLYLDKGTKEGIRADMPVITPDGVVGKVLTVYGDTAQVLMINDPSSGVGAILTRSRLQGIVKGMPSGELQLNYIMAGEAIERGDVLITSGGDRIFPKGLPLGTVSRVGAGHDLFLDIRLKPAADLNRLEEVLVVTQQKPRELDAADLGAVRASDILAGHLPTVPQPAQNATLAAPAAGTSPAQGTAKPGAKPAGTPTAKPAAKPGAAKPAAAAAKPASAPTNSAPPSGASKPGAHGAASAAASAKPAVKPGAASDAKPAAEAAGQERTLPQ